MKYVLALAIVAIALTACTAIPSSPSAADQATPVAAAAHTQTLHFVGPMGLTVTLSSQDHFDTAVMTDNADRTFQMRAVPAASGVRMSNGRGVTIHFKNGDGTVEFVPGKPISIQEFKK